MRDVFIVTVTYNSGNVIGYFLESLKSQGINAKVVIVDNNSEDNTLEEVRRFREKCKHDSTCLLRIDVLKLKKNYFYGGGINVALRYIISNYKPDKDSIIIVSNPDVVFDHNALKTLIEKVSKNALVQCTILKDNGLVDNQGFIVSDAITLYKVGENGDVNYVSPLIRYVNFISGACFAATIETFFKIGYFDERIDLYCEDLEFSLRALCRDIEMIIVPECRVIHLESTSITSSRKKWYLLIKNCGYVAYKYFGLKKLLAYLFLKLIFSITLGGKFIVPFIKGLYVLLRNITLHNYNRVKCNLVRSIYSYRILLRYQLWQVRKRLL